MSSHDQKRRAQDLIRRVQGALDNDDDLHEMKGRYNRRQRVKSDWVETQSLTGGQRKNSSCIW